MDRKISELDQVLNLDEQAEFPLSQDNGGTPTTFKAKLTQLAAKIAEAITFSNLITNDKHIIGAINEAAQGSGASMKFEDLSDVDISNLQDGQFSKYDSTTEKWKNTTIQESDVNNLVSDLADKADKTDLVYEKTASGSIASFTDGGDDIPVSEYECEIVAQQESGTPTPDNPLSITGFSEVNVANIGSNLWSGGDVTFTAQTKEVAISLTPKTYYFSAIITTTDTDADTCSLVVYYTDNTYLSVTGLVRDKRIFTSFTATKDVAKLAFYSSDNYAHGAGDTATWSGIILSENGQTFNIPFGQTIYGGRLIYKDGEWAIEATHGVVVDLGALSWTKGSKSFYADITGAKLYDQSVIPNMLCEVYKPVSYNDLVSEQYNEVCSINNNSSIILMRDTNYATASDFATAVTGKKAIFELATPVIIPITSSTRVKTISGVNNIFSNTGDNSVKYFTENADSLAELIKASESESTGDYHEYSTEEKIVGKWIDGKTLYEKTVVVTNKTAQPSDWAEVVTLSDVDKVAHVEGWFTISTVDYFEGYYVRFMFDHSTNKLKYYCQDMANTNGDITVIIRYTKTSSNTRSLNLSKGVEETEETDEIKTEEVKEEEKNAEQNER